MTASHQKSVPINHPSRKELVVGFSADMLRAPFALRCGALLIDYIVIVLIPITFLLISRSLGNDGARLLNSELNDIGWLLAVLLCVANLAILPLVGGQTIGKMLTGIRVVTVDGSIPSAKVILFRQVIGYLVTGLTLGFGFLLAAFGVRSRALHDYVAGTTVIYADKRRRT
jgi:uncharacterized RDD family membrane protein YckC